MGKPSLTPLTKGGTRTAHVGKGSKSASMGAHRDITAPPGSAPAGLNDYGKSSGQAAPAPTGLGSGTWPGVGG